MKSKRHEKILDLILEFEIETQEELANRLRNAGYDVTQATVSRDIKKLNLIKGAGENVKQKYIKPVPKKDETNKNIRILQDSHVSIDIAKNILVFKTLSGMAMAVAATLDGMNIDSLLGCIAGDDTIICIIKSDEEAVRIKEYLQSLL